MEPTLHIAINAARGAGDIIMRHAEQLDRIKISEKGKHDYFTEVDVKAEQFILQTLLKAYPDHGFIAEESGIQNPDAECVWLIDPLDGTSNYIHGFPTYAVSIAMLFKGKLEHGVIYDPIKHECFAASRGRGARLNDRRIRVSKRKELSGAMIGCGQSIQSGKRAAQHGFSIEPLIEQTPCIRRVGSAALELAYVACGRLDGFFEFSLKPWDVAAGCLIVQEAGGFVSHPDGSDNFIKTGCVVASTPKIFDAFKGAFKKS